VPSPAHSSNQGLLNEDLGQAVWESLMGGSGSTRWRGQRRRALVEEAHCLDLLDQRWKGVLRLHQASGTLEWRGPGSLVPQEWVDFHLSPVQEDGTRPLVLDFTREPTEPKQRLILVEVRVGFSRRWHARCPGGCDGLVRKLYLVEHSAVACWRCAGLQYRSAQRHDKRVDLCRRDPAEFVRGRSHLGSERSRLVTSWLLLEAESRGFRCRAS
jgi:hypothetical protein